MQYGALPTLHILLVVFNFCFNKVYCLLSVVLNNYVIKQIAVKSIHKLILFIEQK